MAEASAHIIETTYISGHSGKVPDKFFFQPKLKINEPDDQYEREADSVAEQVMRLPTEKSENHFFKPALINSIQKKCTECEEEEKLQRKEISYGNNSEYETGNISDVISSGGNRLSETERKYFEPRFGYDFSNVKIHTDTVAAKSAESINALAYTTGNDIVFNRDQYTPDTDKGKKLMAHELTHVIQQNGDNKVLRKTYLGSKGIVDATTIDKESKVKKIIIETLSLEKSSLYPFIKDKLKTVEEKLSKEFIFNPEVFGYKYKKINNIRDPKVKEEGLYKTIGGFLDPKTNDIFLHHRSNYCHAFHETFHAISYHKALRNNFGTEIMEGLTQYFTDIIFKEQTGDVCKTHSYGSQLNCAKKTVGLLGGFSNTASIFFNGKFDLIVGLAKSKSKGVVDFLKLIKNC
ncbi:MAG TPA: DUF4157 domain-containing protein [Ignavibacteria bacterium]|mgnify:CR=1 FL=1|nr:DUF4157 domain-containing protein [Ignavibacteria bacterium]